MSGLNWFVFAWVVLSTPAVVGREFGRHDAGVSGGAAVSRPDPLPNITLACEDNADGHFQCGSQLGAHFAAVIKAAFADDAALQSLYRAIETGEARDVFDSLKRANTLKYPLLAREVEGMATGAQIDPDLVWLANVRQETHVALAKKNVTSKAVPDACTDILVHNERTTGFVHNEDGAVLDFDKVYLVRQTWLDRESSGKERIVSQYVSFCYPGVLPGWAPGWNAFGLAMTWNTLYPRDILLPGPGAKFKGSEPRGGVAVAFVCRDVLARARSVDEAVRLATPADLALGQNLNVGSVGSAKMLTAETAPGGEVNVKGIAALRDVMSTTLEEANNSAAVFHANEYLRLTDVPQITSSITSAKHRRAAFQRTTKNGTMVRSLTDALHFLGDVSDAAYPVFRRNDTTREDTLFTVAFDLRAGTVTVYHDNPRLGEAAVVLREHVTASLGVPDTVLDRQDSSLAIIV